MLDGTHGNLAMMGIGQEMRRLLVLNGTPATKDVSLSENDASVASPLAESEGRESRMAFRKSEKLRE